MTEEWKCNRRPKCIYCMVGIYIEECKDNWLFTIFLLIFPPAWNPSGRCSLCQAIIIHNKCMQNPHSTRCFQLIKGQTNLFPMWSRPFIYLDDFTLLFRHGCPYKWNTYCIHTMYNMKLVCSRLNGNSESQHKHPIPTSEDYKIICIRKHTRQW